MTPPMRLEAVCPICQGCGHVVANGLGGYVPQPSWQSAGTGTADSPMKCPRCEGSGAIVVRHEFIGIP